MRKTNSIPYKRTPQKFKQRDTAISHIRKTLMTSGLNSHQKQELGLAINALRQG